MPPTNPELVARSLAAVWHPCTQMKHHEHFPLVPIVKGEGAWLIDAGGKRYLDAVSSWWVNLFGHANPRINAALKDQLDRLEHVMLAGFTHEPVVALSERLAALTGLGHAFYGSDGASAVEIALKMSFHYWRNSGRGNKQKFISLQGSYHGETIGALAVTDVAIFRDAYGALLNNNLRIPFPGADAGATDALERLLAEHHGEIAALIVEPLVQGAAGMRMYDAAWLTRARELCSRHDVHLIADEIMTGFGRTGTLFACEQADIRADFMCLSKGLTGGYLPLSCVLTTDKVYDAFYDVDIARGFLHSHSYTGSALACRAALATLDIFESDDVIEANRARARAFSRHAEAIRIHPGVENFRQLGMIWAFDLKFARADFARECFAAALKRGVLLRPVGRTVYFMPPYIVTAEEFSWLVTQSLAAIDEVVG
ncbi:MAG: adenosylmethionine--8-amino-7-oxononanoate transaminase [Betaproteobacteria bacterium]